MVPDDTVPDRITAEVMELDRRAAEVANSYRELPQLVRVVALDAADAPAAAPAQGQSVAKSYYTTSSGHAKQWPKRDSLLYHFVYYLLLSSITSSSTARWFRYAHSITTSGTAHRFRLRS